MDTKKLGRIQRVGHRITGDRKGQIIPTRVKADSFRGFQTGASQIPWWRTGGSPCGQGLRSKDLVVPDNLTLVLLPARAPELNPVENIWHFLRENWLSSRVFASYRDIVDHCCDAWNRLIDQPWLIMSIGLRDWANA